MTPLASAVTPASSPSAWVRLHRAFMPDYNRKATAYWWLVVMLGALALLASLQTLAAAPATVWWQIAAGTAIAMLAGFFPMRIPHSKNSFAAGEIFIFLVLLMHGPAAATLAAAGEALVSSWRTSRRWTSRIVSPAMAAVAWWWAGRVELDTGHLEACKKAWERADAADDRQTNTAAALGRVFLKLLDGETERAEAALHGQRITNVDPMPAVP